MKIAIIDDSTQDIDMLEGMLCDYAEKNRLNISVDRYGSAERFVSCYSAFSYSVIFLDIYMGELNGLEAARMIREKDSHIILIFMTNSDEHRGEAFGVHAYEYLEKPLSEKRVFKVMDDLVKLSIDEGEVPSLNFISDKREISLSYADIVIIRTGSHNYLDITDKKGDVYCVRMTFSTVCGILVKENSGFVILNRGVVAGCRYIIDIRDGICYMEGGEALRVNQRREGKLRREVQAYKFRELRQEMRKNSIMGGVVNVSAGL